MTNLTVDNDRTTSTELATLDQATQDKVNNTVAASKAANTLRAYRSDMRQVAKYLADTNHSDMVRYQNRAWHLIKPMPAALIAAYLVERAEHGTAVTSLQRHVASISKWHQVVVADKYPTATNPCQTQLVRDTLTGLRKQNMRQPERAKPLTPGQISAIVHGLELDTTRGTRDKAIILLGWCGALRRSELANLKWSHIKFVPEGLQITVMQSKTDKVGEGQQLGVPYQDNPQLCPVLAMVAWAKSSWADTQSDHPVFTRVAHNDDHTDLPLSGQAIGNIVNTCANHVGLAGFTGHSLRSGLATAAILAGTPEHQVMNTTRHKSQAVFRGYVRHAELFAKAASRGLLS